MSQSSTYFLRQSELRAAEEELGPLSRSGGVIGYKKRAEINAAWEEAARDQEREKQYQDSISNARGEKEHPLPDGF
jgi:hypothetical protein